MSKKPAFIVVAGASAGGLRAFSQLVGQLDDTMDAAFFIVLHLSKNLVGDFFLQKLQQATSLPCHKAINGDPIQRGRIYVAGANEHLLVKKDRIVTGHGPEENRWRPSIDVLFRSAASAYSTRVIGIILTGLLDDGTSGMSAIKRSGGVCIVQDPAEAEYPDMPSNVIQHVDVDYAIPVAGMGGVLMKIMKKKPAEGEAPPEIKAESAIAERMATGAEILKGLGSQSIYACPDCGGGLWKITDGNINRYRCHIGHSYSERELLMKQAETLESSLWVALRVMEERRNLLTRIGAQHKQKGLTRIAAHHFQQADNLEVHIGKLKEMLTAAEKNGTSPSTS